MYGWQDIKSKFLLTKPYWVGKGLELPAFRSMGVDTMTEITAFVSLCYGLVLPAFGFVGVNTTTEITAFVFFCYGLELPSVRSVGVDTMT